MTLRDSLLEMVTAEKSRSQGADAALPEALSYTHETVDVSMEEVGVLRS